MPVGLESFRNFSVGPRLLCLVIACQVHSDRRRGPLYLYTTRPEESQVARAKVLTNNLPLIVAQKSRSQTFLHAQEMELYCVHSLILYTPIISTDHIMRRRRHNSNTLHTPLNIGRARRSIGNACSSICSSCCA
ncbi:hypothetical protein GYMLUDRAFT_922610 [Collybiopsis luxurians FD-317 M1]|uniref:Uncharacterized protein n=1 Tax=Collybiopsis luxurians FD-317 M1 TaxID=944289 RepID=A0A0D0C7M1_9AGAR|nr:hypothetical protein GYMLUDRAFT_922610 [Collybiopsis luxurians FD-317 M1]